LIMTVALTYHPSELSMEYSEVRNLREEIVQIRVDMLSIMSTIQQQTQVLEETAQALANVVSYLDRCQGRARMQAGHEPSQAAHE
jgi:3-dehydroquinate dehydratase